MSDKLAYLLLFHAFAIPGVPMVTWGKSVSYRQSVGVLCLFTAGLFAGLVFGHQ